MALSEQTEMSQSAVAELLARHETGVLSLARGDEPYSIPISYGYDADSQRFYLRLASTADSEKRRFLGSSPAARLVVYESDDPVYRSVLARGTLERIDRSELTAEHVEQYGDAKRPLFEIWGKSAEELDVELYTLEPAELSGRRIEVDR